MVDFSENERLVLLVKGVIGLIRDGFDDKHISRMTGLKVYEVAAVRISPFKSALVPNPNNRLQFDESRDHRLTGPGTPSKPLTATIVPSART